MQQITAQSRRFMLLFEDFGEMLTLACTEPSDYGENGECFVIIDRTASYAVPTTKDVKGFVSRAISDYMRGKPNEYEAEDEIADMIKSLEENQQ